MQLKKKGNWHCPLLQITGYWTHCLYSNMSDHNLYEPSAASITIINIQIICNNFQSCKQCMKVDFIHTLINIWYCQCF